MPFTRDSRDCTLTGNLPLLVAEFTVHGTRAPTAFSILARWQYTLRTYSGLRTFTQTAPNIAPLDRQSSSSLAHGQRQKPSKEGQQGSTEIARYGTGSSSQLLSPNRRSQPGSHRAQERHDAITLLFVVLSKPRSCSTSHMDSPRRSSRYHANSAGAMPHRVILLSSSRVLCRLQICNAARAHVSVACWWQEERGQNRVTRRDVSVGFGSAEAPIRILSDISLNSSKEGHALKTTRSSE